MDENTRIDLHTIFGSLLTDSLMTRLIEHLDGSILTYSDYLAINTRNDNNEILKIQGKTSFAVVEKSNPRRPISTGGMERNRKNDRVATMRFRVNNSALASIHSDHEFAYKKPQWTCVEIRTETIDLIPKLLETEIANFLSQVNSPESTDVIHSRQESPVPAPSQAYNRNRTSVPRPFLILMIALGITVVLVAVLNSPRAPENTQQRFPQTVEETTRPKPSQPDPPKPIRLEKRFTFAMQGGVNVTAKATSDTKSGTERYFVLFSPFLNKTDGNFYLGALAALHNLYGKHRGLFQLNDATRQYDSVVGAYAYYWIIANPSQKYYCLPVVDSETETIASIIVWVK